MSGAKFSERYGHMEIRKTLQVDNLDNGTRRRLWNKIDPLIPKFYFSGLGEENRKFLEVFWDKYFKLQIIRLQEYQNNYDIYNALMKYFFEIKWYKCYDFIEALIEYHYDIDRIKEFIDQTNKVLEEEKCGYRIINDMVAPITSDAELSEVEIALDSSFAPIHAHFEKALEHLSDRTSPDHRNSIKESISAVEAVCQIIVGQRGVVLNRALGRLEEAGVQINEELKKGFRQLYSWTSSDDGIRHAMLDLPSVDQDDARFMLVTCSAFVNYLITEANKAGIDLQANYEAIREN